MVLSRRRDALYLSMGDGSIVRLRHSTGGADNSRAPTAEWETVARTGEALEGCGVGGPAGEKMAPEDRCGRPLGMRLVRRSTVDASTDRDEDVLLVCDAYKGLLMVSGLDTSPARVDVLAARAPGDATDFRLLNDLVQAPDGSIYFTETTTRFQRRQIVYAVYSGQPEGRLLRYSKGSVEVVLSGLVAPNGVTLAHDGKGLLVVVGLMRVARYDFATRQLSPFADLPGSLDNIRTMGVLPNGTERPCYWLTLGSRAARPFSLFHLVAPLPSLRAALAALLPYELLVGAVPKKGILALLGEGGELLATYQDPTGRTPWLSEAELFDGQVYLGSWFSPFLARVPASSL